jgi:hypothetical protein
LWAASFHSSVRCGPVLAAQLAAATTFGAARSLLNRATLGTAFQGSAAAFGPSRFAPPRLEVAASLSTWRSLLAARSSALLLERALRLPAPTLLLTRWATALGARRLTNTRLLLALLAAEFVSLRLASRPRLLGCRTTTLRPLRPTGTRSRGLLALFSTEFLSLRLPARPLLLRSCCAALRSLRLTLAERCRTLRRPWRVLAKPASFACSQRLRRRNSINRRYSAGRFPHSGLAKELITSAFAHPLVADLNRARNARCSRKHQRPHVKRTNGPAYESCDDIRRDAGIDSIAVIAELIRAVDNDGVAEEHVVFAHWYHDASDVPGREVLSPAKDPEIGPVAVLDDHFLGR